MKLMFWKKKAKARRRGVAAASKYHIETDVASISTALQSIAASLRMLSTDDGKALRIALARPFVVEIEKPVRVDIDMLDGDIVSALRGIPEQLAVSLMPLVQEPRVIIQNPPAMSNGRSRR